MSILSPNRILFFILFLIPLAVITYYEYVIASNRFESDASLVINQPSSTTVGTLSFSILGLPTSANDKDALSTVEFIESRDMLHYLDEKLHLRDHYSASRVDWWARFPNTGSFEDFYLYMPNWLTVSYDTTSKLIRIQLQTFDANFSKAVVDAIIARAQKFIDTENAQMNAEQTRFFEEKMIESEAQLKDANQSLITFQRANQLFTTTAESSLILQNLTALEKTVAQAKSEYDSLAKTLTQNAPRLQQMQSDITAMEGQISVEKDRLSGISTSSVSELNAQYADIQLNIDFATTMYKSNLTQLEQARIELARKVKFLVVVAAPSLADQSQWPDRPYNIITMGIIFLSVYFIISMIIATIREHAT